MAARNLHLTEYASALALPLRRSRAQPGNVLQAGPGLRRPAQAHWAVPCGLSLGEGSHRHRYAPPRPATRRTIRPATSLFRRIAARHSGPICSPPIRRTPHPDHFSEGRPYPEPDFATLVGGRGLRKMTAPRTGGTGGTGLEGHARGPPPGEGVDVGAGGAAAGSTAREGDGFALRLLGIREPRASQYCPPC